MACTWRPALPTAASSLLAEGRRVQADRLHADIDQVDRRRHFAVWSSEDALLVGYADGTCAELTLPTEPDTSETYELLEGTPRLPADCRRESAAAKARDALKPKKEEPAEGAEIDPLAPPPEEEEEEEEPDLDAGSVSRSFRPRTTSRRSRSMSPRRSPTLCGR